MELRCHVDFESPSSIHGRRLRDERAKWWALNINNLNANSWLEKAKERNNPKHLHFEPDLKAKTISLRDVFEVVGNIHGVDLERCLTEISADYMQNSVEDLCIGKVPANCIDLEQLTRMISLRLAKASPSWTFVEMPAVTSLSLWGGHFASHPNEVLDLMPNVMDLELVRSNLETFPNCSLMKNLRAVSLFYSSKLSDLEALTANGQTLTHLTIMNCPSLYDLGCLRKLKKLTHLEMHHCGAVKDFRFVEDLENLNLLMLQSGTYAEDGDVKWIAEKADGKFELNFQNKRHYNFVF